MVTEITMIDGCHQSLQVLRVWILYYHFIQQPIMLECVSDMFVHMLGPIGRIILPLLGIKSFSGQQVGQLEVSFFIINRWGHL